MEEKQGRFTVLVHISAPIMPLSILLRHAYPSPEEFPPTVVTYPSSTNIKACIRRRAPDSHKSQKHRPSPSHHVKVQAHREGASTQFPSSRPVPSRSASSQGHGLFPGASSASCPANSLGRLFRIPDIHFQGRIPASRPHHHHHLERIRIAHCPALRSDG